MVDESSQPRHRRYVRPADIRPTDSALAAEIVIAELKAEGVCRSISRSRRSRYRPFRAMGEAIQAHLCAYSNVDVEVEVEVLEKAAALKALTSAGFDAITAEGLEQGRATTDTEARKAAYQLVQERIAATSPVALLERTSFSVLTAQNVGGVQVYNSGSLLPAELRIDK